MNPEGLQPESSAVAYVLSPVVLSSFVLTLLCTYIISPLLLPHLIPHYPVISRGDRFLIGSLLPAILHHSAVPVIAIYAIASGAISDRAYCTSALGFVLMQITLGYLVGDFLLSLQKERSRKDTVMIVHHIVCILSFVVNLQAKGLAMFFAVSSQVAELSSIFFTIRAALKTLGISRSSLFLKINDVLFIVLFFLTRVLAIPWHWYELITALMLSPRSSIIPLHLRLYTYFHFVVIDSINLYWFLLILRSARRYNLKKSV